MVKLSELSREPQEAFQEVLSYLLEIAPSFPQANLNPTTRTKAISCIRTLQVMSKRLENSADYQEPLARAHASMSQTNASGTYKVLLSIEELFIANTLDGHFIDPEEERDFNSLDWQEDDRQSVLKSLDEARHFTRYSEHFGNRQKRRILYWLSKAENEVLKDKGMLASILSAADQIMDAVHSAGDKAKPLGNLIEQMRTTTVKNVSETRQISSDEAPKQLPPPGDDAT